MKALLITDANLGQARAYMAKTLLGAAARKTKLEIINNLNDAEMTIVFSDSIPNDSTLNGKSVWLGDISRAVAHPELFLGETKGHAKPYAASVAATAPVIANGPKRVVAVTACPTGVAHIFVTAKATETEAKERGWWMRVEAYGSVGAGNIITPEEVAAADLVIVAIDIEVDLAKFADKPVYRTFTGLALEEATQELDKAVVEVTPYGPAGEAQTVTTEGRKGSTGTCRHLSTGVSYMLPIIVAGGLCITLSFVFGIEAFKGPGMLAAALMQISDGSASALMMPVLASYITFSIVDRLGLTPGLTGGMLAASAGSGFIGDIIAGFLAGYTTKLISAQLKPLQSMEALRPILIILLIPSLVVGLAMIYLIGKPVAGILEGLAHWPQAMGTANTALLGVIPGGMMYTDMGGPIDKAVCAFGVDPLSTQTYGLMAAIMAVGMVSPLAIGLVAMVARRKFDKAQQEGGKAALVLGLCLISEGVTPFAAHDLVYMLPCCVVGGAPTGAISMAVGAKLMAPHSGLFALLIPGAITPVLSYLVTVIAGTLVAGLTYTFLKRSEADAVAEAV